MPELLVQLITIGKKYGDMPGDGRQYALDIYDISICVPIFSIRTVSIPNNHIRQRRNGSIPRAIRNLMPVTFKI